MWEIKLKALYLSPAVKKLEGRGLIKLEECLQPIRI